ncbi:MAG TPA: hypothetical protein VMG12_31105 [Polyangiaceae bacterium]|nr:hypothetical protein [Polyangiaceae bacterium]
MFRPCFSCTNAPVHYFVCSDAPESDGCPGWKLYTKTACASRESLLPLHAALVTSAVS